MELAKIDYSSEMKLHEGEVLLRIADTYKTLLTVLYEIVQNGIDAEPKNIQIIINRVKRTIRIMDDGNGVTKKQFEEALCSVGLSIKNKGKLGRFGLGLISPLGKCKRLTFTSTRKRRNSSYLSWTFETADIKRRSVLGSFPCTEMTGMVFSNKRKPGVVQKKLFVNWRTCVEIFGYVSDSVISDLSMIKIKEGILDLYGPTIRRKKINISVEINNNGKIDKRTFTAEDFTGKKLPAFSYKEKDAGKVVFNLFVANPIKGKRKGKISLGELDDEFRFPMANFLRTVGHALNDEIIKVFRSGTFEGEILSQNCALQASRKNFEENDASLGLCVAIDAWYRKFGKKKYAELQSQRTENRYQDLGQRSLTAVAGLVSYDKRFKELIESFKVGSIGQGHTTPRDARINGPQEKKSKALSGKKLKKGKSPGGKSQRQANNGNKKERSGHTPLSVIGPKGKHRTRVYNNSLGIQLAHEPLLASRALWKFDKREGVLILNTKHPLWDTCDVSDSVLMKYQEFLIVCALTHELMPEDWKESSTIFSEELVNSHVYMLLNADKLAGRQRGRKKTA